MGNSLLFIILLETIMNKNSINLSRSKAYHFLSTLYRDEISIDLIQPMKHDILDELIRLQKSSIPEDCKNGLEKMVFTLNSGSSEEIFQKLRYDYAGLFLNAGSNPAFPYESCYTPRGPVVMHSSIFKVRKAYHAAGVHKSQTYADLDDHISVELEYMGHLARQAAEHDTAQEQLLHFLQGHLMTWVDPFCTSIINGATTSFYKGLAQLTAAVIPQEEKLASALIAGEEITGAYIQFVQDLGNLIKALNLPDTLVTLAKGAVEPAPARAVKSHCYTCLGLCGQEIKVEDNVITGCRGLPNDPKGGGRLCIKGVHSQDTTYSAYRLKTPLLKENGRFRKASWDEALDLVAEKLNGFDPNTVAFHRGNDFNNWCHEAVMSAYGTPHKTTHRQMCDNPNRMANEHCLSEKRPWIDYAHTQYILLFGINEWVTSAGQRKLALLKKAVKNGVKMVVVDPRRSETAEAATEWIPIIPGTDGAMAMGMCYVIVVNELYDKAFLANWCHGFQAFKKRLLGQEDGIARSPEWASRICGVPAETIERLAFEFASSAPAAGASSWTGVSQAPNTVHATQAIQALNALMGCFDAPGGPSLVCKFKLASAWGDDQPKPPNNADKIKLNKGRLWSGWIPAYFEQDVDAGRLKAMVCYLGNPVMSSGSEPAMTRAVEKLAFSCTIDCFLSNTAALCDVVLPDCTYLEQSRVVADWMYESFISLGQKAIEPLYQSKPVVWIFTQLAKRLGYGDYFPWEHEDEYLENQLRNQPVDLAQLRELGFYVTDPQAFYKYKTWGSINPPSGYGSSGNSVTEKYNFINPAAQKAGVDGLPDYIPPYEDWPELKPDDTYPFITGYFRVKEHEHCATSTNIELMKQCGHNAVWINHVDAQKYGIENGDTVRILSPWGEVTTTAVVTWGIRQGVLAAEGGFGSKFGLEGDPKYPQYHGFNTNVLLPPNVACKWSGTPPLKYIKTRIEKISS